MLIGAGPHTDWLEKTVQCDERGHILTGSSVVRHGPVWPKWSEERAAREYLGGE